MTAAVDLVTLPTARRGDTGEHVRILQTTLQRQGWYAWVADGVFGRRTEYAVRRFQEAHLGPEGTPLLVDGIVGQKTWWALKYPSGEAQKSGIKVQIPVGTSAARHAFLEILLHEHAIGVKEIPDGSNWSTAPEGGIAKYATYDSVSGPAAWCMRFVKWGLRQAVSRGVIPTEPASSLRGGGSCRRTRASAEDLNESFESGVWFENDGDYVPRPGDIAIMEGHVFVVVCVDWDGDVFTGVRLRMNSVEGNAGNRVKVGVRKGSQVLGFINVFGDGEKDPEFRRGVFSARDLSADSTR